MQAYVAGASVVFDQMSLSEVIEGLRQASGIDATDAIEAAYHDAAASPPLLPPPWPAPPLRPPLPGAPCDSNCSNSSHPGAYRYNSSADADADLPPSGGRRLMHGRQWQPSRHLSDELDCATSNASVATLHVTIVSMVVTTSSRDTSAQLQSAAVRDALTTLHVSNAQNESLYACAVLDVTLTHSFLEAPSPSPPRLLAAAEDLATAQEVAAVTVAIATAGATAAAVAGAIGGAAGGGVGGTAGTGGGGGSGGGGAVAGMMPLIFGAQRLCISSGLACNQSELSTGLFDSMSWSTGELGLVGSKEVDAAQQAGRRLHRSVRRLALRGLQGDDEGDEGNGEDAPPSPLCGPMIRLLDVLSTFGIAMGLALSVQLTCHCCYKYHRNREYYNSVRIIGEDWPSPAADTTLPGEEAAAAVEAAEAAAPACVPEVAAEKAPAAAIDRDGAAADATQPDLDEAAARVQAHVRRREAAKVVATLSQEHKQEADEARAAASLQSMFRQRKARAMLIGLLEQRTAERSANRVQIRWRRRAYLRNLARARRGPNQPPPSPPASPPDAGELAAKGQRSRVAPTAISAVEESANGCHVPNAAAAGLRDDDSGGDRAPTQLRRRRFVGAWQSQWSRAKSCLRRAQSSAKVFPSLALPHATPAPSPSRKWTAVGLEHEVMPSPTAAPLTRVAGASMARRRVVPKHFVYVVAHKTAGVLAGLGLQPIKGGRGRAALNRKVTEYQSYGAQGGYVNRVHDAGGALVVSVDPASPFADLLLPGDLIVGVEAGVVSSHTFRGAQGVARAAAAIKTAGGKTTFRILTPAGEAAARVTEKVDEVKLSIPKFKRLPVRDPV